jgi:hypothetical protein
VICGGRRVGRFYTKKIDFEWEYPWRNVFIFFM